ncbi:MAG: endonuclease [Ignavibacteriaceae bacterium]|nr:endonuclease [Ignavibacteriaceae bacterium]
MINASYRGKQLTLSLKLLLTLSLKLLLTLSLTLILSTETVFAQAGTYYDALTPSASSFVSDLKTRIRSPYTQISYTPGYVNTLINNFYAINNGDGTKSVFCVYSGYEFIWDADSAFKWTVFSREHTFCHSWMPTHPSELQEYSDQHHLFPTHQNNANNRRSNHPLGVVTTPTYTFMDGKLGTNASSQVVYEPRDKQKGDAARAILYMLVRYDGVDGNTWNMNWLNNTRLPSLSEAPQDLTTLLNWHKQDPPDKYEIDRINYIQSIQGNRNPFADHPEYINYINFNDLTKLSPSYSTEPANYPTALSTSTTSSSVQVNWTDATAGSQAPSGYLIIIYNADNYYLPIDGETYSDDTDLSDGKGVVNVDYSAANNYTFNTGLSSNTAYYVTIYSYNGTGSSRNYKINGTLPQVTGTTSSSSNTVVNFVGTSSTVSESVGTVNLTVGITNPSPSVACTVQVALTSGAASDLNNYTTQNVIFPANSSANQTVTVTVTDDALAEGDEGFVFTLQNVSGGTSASIGSSSTYTLTVQDNDVTTVQFTSSSATVGEGSGTYNLTLSITNPSPSVATVATVDLVSGDPADVGSFASQEVTFPANSSANQTVTVTITDDDDVEGTGVFEFSIESVSGGNSAQAGTPGIFTLTIIDNDGSSGSNVFEDNFSTNTSATWTTSGAIGSSSWSVVRLGADWGARRNTSPAQLELTNDASAATNESGWIFAYTPTSGFSSPYSTTLSSNPGLITWKFNMRQIRTDPAGFSSGSYGVAFILAGSTISSVINSGTGYAVALGQTGSTDAIRLIKLSGGLSSSTNLITSNTTGLTDFGAEYISVSVTYDPANNQWELFLRNDGATEFSDPASGILTSQGTVIDNTYTSTALNYMGAYWAGSTAASQTAFFDNVSVKVQVTTPAVTLADNGTQVAAANANQGSTNHILSTFKATVADANAELNSLTFTAGGSFIAGDITNFKLYTSTTSSFPGGDPIGSISGAGIDHGEAVTFSSLTQECNIGIRYFWITADISETATYLNTINVPSLSNSNFTFEAGTVSGTITAGGIQTFPDCTPTDVTGASATAGNAQASVAFTLPACYTEIMIVAKPSSSVSASPSGDGSAYTANLAFGSGTLFDGTGRVVYKGTTSPQTVTGLTNGTTYYFKIFTRRGSVWSAGSEVSATPINTELLLEENFNYTAATYLTDNGWTAHNAGGTNPITVNASGLTFPNYPSTTGNAALVDNTGEDIHRTFTTQTSGNVYASFLVKVDAVATVYFIHFGPASIGTTFRGRVFITADGSNFKFGLSKGSNTGTYSTASYSKSQTYLLVLKYEIISGSLNDKVSLFVFNNSDNYETEPGTPTIGPLEDAAISDIDPSSIALRQADAGQNIVVDGIRIGTGWGNSPLPVELSTFTAKQTDGTVKLNWITATEVNNYGFEIQRSENGEQGTEKWEKIGFVPGNGNSNSEKSYSFTDRNVSSATKYLYRLKQIDTDGKSDYSNVIEITTGVPERYDLAQNYPNPFNPSTVLAYQLMAGGNVKLTVYDLLGEEVAEVVNGKKDAGSHSVKFYAGQLNSGIYFYRLTVTGDNGEMLFSSTRKMSLIK